MRVWSLAAIGCVLFASVCLGACGQRLPPPRVAERLDAERYMGTWHEIARLPFKYEEDCFGSSARYEMLNDEEFHITNYCWYRSFFGPMRKAEADALIPDPQVPAKIKVQFFWPIVMDYWVLYVSDDYRHAVVGTPDRKYLWILSRDLAMEDDALAALVDLARGQGYAVEQLIITPQQTDPAGETVSATTETESR